MRIVVVGPTGSGKTTVARTIAGALRCTHIEEDALNWGPGWRALTQSDPAEFARRIGAATAAESWVVDGNYGAVRELVWRRATHLVWLDYPRSVVMRRVLARSLARSARRTALWSGNRENWRGWLRASHPVWWAWRSARRRRAEIERLLGEDAYRHLAVLRLRRPDEAPAAIRRLRDTG